MAYQKKLTSWSYSRYNDYTQCPAKAKYKHIDKLKEPGNDAMARGSAIGKLAEQFLKGQLKKLPVELKLFKDDFLAGQKLGKKRTLITVVEDTWAFTKDWVLTTWDDWTGCWLRVKLDWAFSTDHETLFITDWKTGKFRPEEVFKYLEQLEIYAMGGLLKFPHIKRVLPRLAYLDHGRVYPDPKQGEETLVYERKDLPALQKAWTQRTKAMLSDTKFAPRPNSKCQWCHYRKSNGGPCKF